MKYPYASLDITSPDCGPRTRKIGTRLHLEEWTALQEHTEGNTITKHTTYHRSRARLIILTLVLSLGLCFKTTTLLLAQEPKVTSLMSKDLKEFPGKELLMITVEHAPGGATPIHVHNA